jgi:hypothetical protein
VILYYVEDGGVEGGRDSGKGIGIFSTTGVLESALASQTNHATGTIFALSCIFGPTQVRRANARSA